MLTRLHIKDFALISEITLEFENGLTVLTGETGSGKSILLGALGLAIGERGNIASIRKGASLCIVEATFSTSPTETHIRREINANGKSRAFVNDSQISIGDLKLLGARLVDLHGQDETRALLDRTTRLNLLDSFGGHDKTYRLYLNSFEDYISSSNKLKKLEAEANRPQADKDYLSFQLDELEELNLENLDSKELETEYNELSHATELASGLHSTYELLELASDGNDVSSIVDKAIRELEDISQYSLKASALLERLLSSKIELNDIAQEADNLAGGVTQDPNRLQIVEDKMESLSKALHKHRAADSVALKLVKVDLQNQLNKCEGLSDAIELCRIEKTAFHKAMIDSGEILLSERKKSGLKLLQIVSKELVPLKLPNVMMTWEFEKLTNPDSLGIEEVELFFSANPGSPTQPLASVASGGERSRVMLAFKAALALRKTVPTIVFDEIDTGVSGDVATRMAKTMLKMSNTQQVFSVTHLAQVAAKGTSHIEISKETSEKTAITLAKHLNQDERKEAIATMLSGSKISDEARAAAEVLLNS